jgi:hypothetical protein
MHLVHTARTIGVITLILLSVGATPLHAQDFACAFGSPATDPSASTFLSHLLGTVQFAWSGPPTTPNAAKQIDPLAEPPAPDLGTGDIVTSCSSNAGALCFAHLGLTTCEHVTTSYNVSTYAGLSNVTITSLDIGAFNSKDVATHSAWGPDAGKVTDGVFAPEGTTWNNPSFTVILTNVGEGYAVTVDLGSTITICGTSACAPYVQADRHNMELDWWDDTNQTWQVWGGTCESSGSGLISRKVIPSSTPGSVKCGTNANGPNFTTRYVRLWALPGADDTNFSVSEIQLKDTNSNIVSTGKVAIGPRPYVITDGVFAKEGSTWNDKTYAVVLRNDGPGNALVIDLGGIVSICGTGTCQPVIQADKNVFQIDYSQDGVSWVSYAQLPAASSDGLTKRSPTITSSTPSTFMARYVRIWGCSTTDCPDSINNDFSVSEVQLNNTSGVNVSKGALTFGPEGVATNGAPTADSTNVDWNDPRFTTILSPCLSSAPKCAQLGSAVPLTGPLFVDLTATFPISGIAFQGDRHPFQVDYLDESSTPSVWKALWSIPHSLASGLSSRTTTFTGTQIKQARHLMIYGTQDSNDPDSNYSVSSLRVFTQTANTACGYASAANYGQTFACTYDAPLQTQLFVPSPGLSISFTIDSASSHLRCTNGTTSGNWTALKYPDGTTCTATLNVGTQPSGGYCSGSCSSSLFVATNANLDAPADPQHDPPTFVLTSLSCNNSVQKEDSSIPGSDVDNFTDGLITFVQQIAAEAVTGLFNGLVRNPQLTPHIPNNACPQTFETPNTTLAGSATQVGSNDDNGHVRLSGEADIPASTRLDAVAFTLEQVLFERGGVEELVRTSRRGAFAPLQLELQPGSKETRAVYATPPSHVPSARAKLSRTKTGSMAFDIHIDRAQMPTLPNCAGAPRAAELATRFTLDDAGNSITVLARQNWLCQGKHLRTP